MLGRIYPPRTTLCGSVHSGGEMCRQVTEQLEDALGLQPRPRPGSPGRVPVPVGPDGAERGHLHEPSPASAPIGSVQRARWRADPESRAPRICVAGRSPLPLNACLELLLAHRPHLAFQTAPQPSQSACLWSAPGLELHLGAPVLGRTLSYHHHFEIPKN